MPSVPRRVLHLIDTGGPGGAETIFLNVVTGLGALGFESIPVVPVDDWLAGALREAGFTPRLATSMRSFDLGYAAAIRRLARRERVDLVQTHLLGTAVYGTLATWAMRLPVVSTFHGIADIRATQGLSGVKLKLLGGRRRRLVFVSEPLRTHFLSVERGMAPERTRVIPNGIDADRYAPGRDGALRRELSIPEGAPLVGAVGNIRAPKAYDNLLRAFARVVEKVPEARLVVAGQPLAGLWEELLALKGALGLDGSAHFLGFREDVPEILKALDVFALSSSDEGFSLVTVQAMATGLPVVVTRSGGPETIVEEGVSGHLVPPSDPDALADGILKVLRAPDRGAALGAAGRERAVREFSLTRMVERYGALYGELLGS